MKKYFIIILCLFAFFVSGQQTKPARDSTWQTLKKNLLKLQKQAAKKVAQLEQYQAQTLRDTVVIDLDYGDSLSIYESMKATFDSIEQAKKASIPKEKKKFFDFLKRKKMK